MKKATAFLVAVAAICIALTGCSCKHEYEEKITAEASCSMVGIKTFICTKCNESYAEEIPTIEHKFGEVKVIKQTTCIAEGEKAANCTVCGETGAIQNIPIVEHSYQMNVKTEPTCTEKGVNTLTCSVCNDSSEEFVKELGHNYQQSAVITQVGCTSEGQITMSCSRCKDSYRKTQQATGHKWVDASCVTAKHCENCDQKEGEPLGHNYSNSIPSACDRCGAKKMSLTVDSESSNATLKYHVESTNVTVSKIIITNVWYDTVYDGSIMINIKIKKTFDGYNGSEPSKVGFAFKVFDSNGNLVKHAAPVFSDIKVGQYYTISYVYNLEPDAYTIVFEDKIE